jgi:hypothetical protein
MEWVLHEKKKEEGFVARGRKEGMRGFQADKICRYQCVLI